MAVVERILALPPGRVSGLETDGVVRYLGIPYAAAPVGEHRFRRPQPVQPWSGLRDGTTHGPTAPQVRYPPVLDPVLPTVTVPGDEYLNLNIWAPADARDAPVLVWIHGGSLAHGSNALDAYDGTAFARDGVVLVSINYRLGSEGFSVLQDVPLNLGLADQWAALRWVQDHIALVGGDPARVTVAGHSAGGAGVAALAAHPDSGSVMCRAIIQSGPLQARSVAAAGAITRATAKFLDIPCTRDAFTAVPAAELLRAQSRVTARTPLTAGLSFGIAIGEDLVPQDPLDALCADSELPLLLGTTTQEYRLWFVPSRTLGSITRAHLLAARLKFGIAASAVRTYRRNRPGAPSGVVLGALATDLLLRVPATRAADARSDRCHSTWVYEFDWRSPVSPGGSGPLGAAHAMELGFVFDRLDSPDALALSGPTAPPALAARMHGAWVDFVTTGAPGWPSWTADRPVQRFDGLRDPLLFAPREDERRSLTD